MQVFCNYLTLCRKWKPSLSDYNVWRRSIIRPDPCLGSCCDVSRRRTASREVRIPVPRHARLAVKKLLDMFTYGKTWCSGVPRVATSDVRRVEQARTRARSAGEAPAAPTWLPCRRDRPALTPARSLSCCSEGRRARPSAHVRSQSQARGRRSLR